VESLIAFGFFCQKQIAQTKKILNMKLGIYYYKITFFEGI
tara:strand:- start:377 stop:496 length:120 start_codon:yes stop_codon:yes gene_type:complete